MSVEAEMVDGAAFLAVIDREIEARGGLYALAAEVEASGAMAAQSFARRLWVLRNGRQHQLTFNVVDAVLTAIGRPELVESLLPVEYVGGELICEDCGKEIEQGDYRPLDLMRPDPEAPAHRVWDVTKQKWVRRPRSARQGGRRFRRWDLCRKCAAEALRKRGGSSVSVNGKKRYLKTRERIEPKRGGRPRLLTDDDLRTLHRLYVVSGESMISLGKMLATTREKGSASGYTQALMYGWRRLHLPITPRGEASARARRRLREQRDEKAAA